MDDERRSPELDPQTKRAQGGVRAPHLDPDGPDAEPGVIERMTPVGDLPADEPGRADDADGHDPQETDR